MKWEASAIKFQSLQCHYVLDISVLGCWFLIFKCFIKVYKTLPPLEDKSLKSSKPVIRGSRLNVIPGFSSKCIYLRLLSAWHLLDLSSALCLIFVRSFPLKGIHTLPHLNVRSRHRLKTKYPYMSKACFLFY